MTARGDKFLGWSVLLIVVSSSVSSAVPYPNTRAVPLKLQRILETKETKIVGGYPASEGEAPWQVGLLYYGSLFCGGTLLSQDVVLTAAHCVVQYGILIEDFQIGLGGLRQPNLPFKTSVKKVIAHSEYNENTYINDIALVILEDPVENFTCLIYPAELPFKSNEDYVSQEVTASGWGSIFSGSSLPEQLQAVQLEVWPQESCANAWMSYVKITDNMLCAGVDDFSKSGCHGDSGGPLVKIYDNYSEIVGITSFGNPGCAVEGYPGVYTRVTEYLDWIQEKSCEAGSCLEYTTEDGTEDPYEVGDCNAATFNMNHFQLLVMQICFTLMFLIIQ